MSTELQGTRNLQLTQYCGPARDDGKSRMRLQITQGLGGLLSGKDEPGYINVSHEEAEELALALLQWRHGARPEAES